MIYIKENKTRYLPGPTSLFLYFSKDAESVLTIVKSIEERHFDKNDLSFEVPLTYLSFLLDELTPLDDIKLTVLNETNSFIIPESKLEVEYRVKPFQHQIDAIKYGLAHDKWLLLDAPGLGKTLSIIYLAEELKKQKGIKHCLVVCGVASLQNNWKKEIEKFSNLSCRVLGEIISKKGNIRYKSLDDRVKEIEQGIEEFFIITNIEAFREKRVPKEVSRGKHKGVVKNEICCPILDALDNAFEKDKLFTVIDEAHAVKNQTAKQTIYFRKLDCKYKVAATGTLLVNNPLESYTALNWIGRENASPSLFEKYYCVYGGFGGHQIVGYRNMSVLKEEIEGCSLRRTKDLLDLPPKTVINEYLDLDNVQEQFYTDVVNGVKEECDKIEKLNPDNILAMTTRLRQASVLPSILTSKEIPSVKIDRCVDLVNQLVEQGEKVVVMSTFIDSINKLNEILESQGIKTLVCTGNTSESDIAKGKEKFQEDNEHYVLLCTWQKMGTGHTLNRASYMVFLDTPWTFGEFDQTCDRIHRIGSKKPVFIYNLIALNTIDEKVLELVNRKKALSEFIIDDNIDEDTLEVLKNYIEGL